MTSYPLPTLAATIGPTGISAPTYADCIGTFQAQYQGLFGSDVSLDPSTQDGQWLAILSQAVTDVNAVVIGVYNQFSPATAIGAGLASVVKINGMRKQGSTNSTSDLTIVGQAFTPLVNCVAEDLNGNFWLLPPSFVIPIGGSIVQTAVCLTPGAVLAPANTINIIATPSRGWQTVNNASNAVVGANGETDAALRQRQSQSTANNSSALMDGIVGVVRDLTGVLAVMPYENDSSTTDGNGLPGHSISLVVEGGDAVAIATAIASKKTPGTGTYGTTSELVLDAKGVPATINFYRPTLKRVIASVTGTALPGYVSTTGDAIKAALAAYVSGLTIGGDVYHSKCASNADLAGNPLSATFNLTSVQIAFYGNSLGTADLVIAFNELANLLITDITLSIT